MYNHAELLYFTEKYSYKGDKHSFQPTAMHVYTFQSNTTVFHNQLHLIVYILTGAHKEKERTSRNYRKMTQ